MRELTLNEFDLVSGGMTWRDRRQSDNVGIAQYDSNGTHIWTDYPGKGVCEPAQNPEDGNGYCEDGGNY